jgi:hypothetical protein
MTKINILLYSFLMALTLLAPKNILCMDTTDSRDSRGQSKLCTTKEHKDIARQIIESHTEIFVEVWSQMDCFMDYRKPAYEVLSVLQSLDRDLSQALSNCVADHEEHKQVLKTIICVSEGIDSGEDIMSTTGSHLAWAGKEGGRVLCEKAGVVGLVVGLVAFKTLVPDNVIDTVRDDYGKPRESMVREMEINLGQIFKYEYINKYINFESIRRQRMEKEFKRWGEEYVERSDPQQQMEDHRTATMLWNASSAIPPGQGKYMSRSHDFHLEHEAYIDENGKAQLRHATKEIVEERKQGVEILQQEATEACRELQEMARELEKAVEEEQKLKKEKEIKEYQSILAIRMPRNQEALKLIANISFDSFEFADRLIKLTRMYRENMPEHLFYDAMTKCQRTLVSDYRVLELISAAQISAKKYEDLWFWQKGDPTSAYFKQAVDAKLALHNVLLNEQSMIQFLKQTIEHQRKHPYGK